MTECNFFSKEIQYLGHILSTTGIWPLPSKTHGIQHMQPPTTPKQVQAFLWLVGYYRKFIKGFLKLAKPLTLLSHQQVKFYWTAIHHTTFLNLKEAIIQAPMLCYPDPYKKYIIYTDASDNACRATTRTWWNRISCSLLVTHIYRNTKKMEHNWTGGLWSLLHDN